MLSTLLTVWLLHVAALATPGANVLLVSHLAAKGDRRGATYAAVGVTIGAVVWSTAAVLGVSALFIRVPALRLALQLAGAAYLIYVAHRIWRTPLPTAKPAGRLASDQALRAGLLTNLSNPKAALFFGSIFTSALPSHPGASLLVASILLVLVNALAWHLLLAFLFSRPTVQAGYASRRGALSRVAGLVVGVMGLSLLLAALNEMR
jgi:threonine/homoserine/homoserine lactone efflux protein